MSHVPLLVPDQSGSLEPSAFHAQLRRLESLQALMTQGGVVVSEVAEFLAKAREELSALQREHASCAEVQQRWSEEKVQLASQLTAATAAAEEAASQVKQYEDKISLLEGALAESDASIGKAQLEEERKTQSEQLRAAADRISLLESALQKEKMLRQQMVGKVRQDEASSYATEIALLKSRLSALEHQLEAERERRTRLMEVVKVHEVSVSAQKQREHV